jgi:hypothetical protein
MNLEVFNSYMLISEDQWLGSNTWTGSDDGGPS